MRTKKAYLIITIIAIFFSACLMASVNAQTPTPEPTSSPNPTPTPTPTTPPYEPNLISVVLEEPINNTEKTDSFNVTFTFKPTILGSDKFIGATLILNGTITSATNQTALVNNTSNALNYVLPSNGTYTWNIELRNSSWAVTAPENFTVSTNVYIAPQETPTPAPTSTATPAQATPAPTATATSSEMSTPIPSPTGLEIWTIVIVAAILIAGVTAIVIVLRHKALRPKTRQFPS